MEKFPTVSVLISSYNHEQFVGRTIESVLHQSFSKWELIIRDDGSTDGTSRIIESYKDPRIKYLGTGKNLGASHSFNHCIQAASAPYISILTSDDLFEANKLELQVCFMENHPEFAAVFSKAHFISDSDETYEEDHPYLSVFDQPNRDRYDWLRYFFTSGNCLCDPSAMVRKSVYDKVGVYDPRLASLPDFDLWIRICIENEIYILPDRLVRFRLRSNEENQSGMRPANLVRLRAEHPLCLEHFRKLTREEFVRVFPDEDKLGRGEWFDVEFALTRQCLLQNSVPVRQFGLGLLAEIARNPSRMAEIEHHFGYGYPELHRDFQKFDLTGVAGPAFSGKSQVHYQQVDGRRITIESELCLGANETFEVNFQLPADFAISEQSHWSPLAKYPLRLEHCNAETNLGSVGLFPINFDRHNENEALFFSHEALYQIKRQNWPESQASDQSWGQPESRIETERTLAINAENNSASAPPAAEPRWLKIIGRIHVLDFAELMNEFCLLADNMRLLEKNCREMTQYIASQNKQLCELKNAKKKLISLLQYISASPFRAISFCWNRKSLNEELRKHGVH